MSLLVSLSRADDNNYTRALFWGTCQFAFSFPSTACAPCFSQHGSLVIALCAVGGIDQSGKSYSSQTWMSSRVDSAIPTRLSSIRNELIGKKLRVVGKYVPNQADRTLLVTLALTSVSLSPLPLSPHFLSPRVLNHDVRSSTILLWNDSHIVLADISLCLPTKGSVSWLREPRSTVTLLGYLEPCQVTSYYLCLGTCPQWEDSRGWRAPRAPGRQTKWACRSFCQRSCPMKIWYSLRACRCRRSWCSIPRMWILGFGMRRSRRWRLQVSINVALSAANPGGCGSPTRIPSGFSFFFFG